MYRPHVVLAVAGILTMVGCDKSPVQPPISPALTSPEESASSGPALSISGPGILSLSSYCSFYNPIGTNDDGTVPFAPSMSVTWTVSDTRVIRFPLYPNSGSTITIMGAAWVCGTITNAGAGYGYATLTAQWTSPKGTRLTATLPVEFGPTPAGVVPVNVIITGGTRTLAPRATTQLTAQTYDQFAHAKNKWANWTSDAPSVAAVSSCQCSSNGTVTAGTANGTAHVTANVNGTTSAPVTITVITPLQLTITGPRAPATNGQYTWTANASGGTGVYTYQWQWRYVTSWPGWAPLGTGQSQSLDVDIEQPAFKLQVTVSSGVLSKSAQFDVYPVPPPPSPCGHWEARPVYDDAGQETGSYVNGWVPEECPSVPCTSGHWESQPILDGNGEETGSYQMVWVPDPGCTLSRLHLEWDAGRSRVQRPAGGGASEQGMRLRWNRYGRETA